MDVSLVSLECPVWDHQHVPWCVTWTESFPYANRVVRGSILDDFCRMEFWVLFIVEGKRGGVLVTFAK